MQKPNPVRVGQKRHENVATGGTSMTTTMRLSTMKWKRRSGNWDLMYGFGFLVLFILVHTMFITHETRSFKQESSNVSASDLQIQRARKLKQNRKELIEAVEKMKEPHPANRKEAAAIALNSVFRKNLKSRNFLLPWHHDVSDAKSRRSVFRDACLKENLTQIELSDCVNDNEMSARRAHVQKRCDQIKEDPTEVKKLTPYVDSKKIYVLKYRKLVWCPVYKSASTNWISMLPTLSNFRPSQIKILKRRFIQKNELATIVAKPLPLTQFRKFVSANDPIKFLIVRHPFDRILSAYRDKLERMNEHFHQKYGEDIVRKYRHQGIEKFGKDFYENKNGSSGGCPEGVASCDRGDGATPTFWEFVRALLDGEVAVDDHWRPVHLACSLCRLTYDAVLHFEYLSDEQPYFLRQLGLENLAPDDKWQQHSSPNPLTRRQKLSYFKMLDESEIRGLYNFYKVDFDLFEYDLKSYLEE